jgi:hypothetical protein
MHKGSNLAIHKMGYLGRRGYRTRSSKQYGRICIGLISLCPLHVTESYHLPPFSSGRRDEAVIGRLHREPCRHDHLLQYVLVATITTSLLLIRGTSNTRVHLSHQCLPKYFFMHSNFVVVSFPPISNTVNASWESGQWPRQDSDTWGRAHKTLMAGAIGTK